MIRCIKCNSKVSYDRSYYCGSCGHQFSSVNNIPIFLPFVEEYLCNKVLSAEDQIRSLESDIVEGSDLPSGHKFNRINSAIGSQVSLVREFQNTIVSQCTIPSLLKCIGSSEKLGYGISFEYLIRDWSFSKDTESEIRKIREAILSVLDNSPKRRVLVLGAGLGRLAFDLLDSFKEVYAIDISLEMPFLLEKLVTEKKIEFTYYHRKNVLDEDSLFSSYNISSSYLEQKIDQINTENFKYSVADVTNLPFFNEQFDAVISCYFTDVIPVSSIISEVTRVIKKNGLFVHFGPFRLSFFR